MKWVVICMEERPSYLTSTVFERTWRPDPWAVSWEDIRHNAQLKVYPDGSASLLACNRRIFRESGFEERRPEGEAVSHLLDSEEAAAGEGPKEPDPENVSRARRRARAALVDLARSTNFRYFVTLTLDKERISRYDEREVIRRLNTWLDNQVRRKGLAYVLVPEHHKDGAIHFHGLITDGLTMEDSGTVKLAEGGKPKRPRSKAQRAAWLAEGGHTVYNVKEWRFGFSSALELYGDRRAAIGYTTKYIGKEGRKIGGRWYYSGGPLGRPSVHQVDVDFEKVQEAAGERGSFAIGELDARAARLDAEKGADLYGWLEQLAWP